MSLNCVSVSLVQFLNSFWLNQILNNENLMLKILISFSFLYQLRNQKEDYGFFLYLYSNSWDWRSEKTKIGSALSGALVSTLVGLAASNLGIISCEAPAYSVVLNFLLPLAVPLLLFRADLRRVIQSTGALLMAFLIGSGHMCWYCIISVLHF